MRRLTGIIAAIALSLVVQRSAAATAETIACHRPAIDGMEDRITSIHKVVGPDTHDPHAIRMHITREDGRLFVQSNFLATILGTKTSSKYPTKILWSKDSHPDLLTTTGEILFEINEDDPEAGVPKDWREQARDAIAHIDVTIDPSVLGPDGRPPFDLTGVRSVHLANDHQSLASGEIELIRLPDPPPALMERLDGCCFNGRPPGAGGLVDQRLRSQPVSADKAVLLSMVVDSGTKDVIASSELLSTLERRAGTAKAPWPERLDKALSVSKGQTLIVLAHVLGDRVVIEDAAQREIYSIGLEELQSRADKAGAHLILFGCETARTSKHLPVGVLGKYNTAFAANRIEAALPNSKNARDFMSAVATEGLTIVVQPGNWSPRGTGAGIYQRPTRPGGLFRRLYRVWSMGRAG